VVTREEIERRREALASSDVLRALEARLRARVSRVLSTPPVIPEVKGALSADGGFCPADGRVLVFDPWSPEAYRCPACGAPQAGERHHQWWARHQHLWLAERAAEMAAVAALGHAPAARGASRLLAEYGRRYLRYPNRDNVLGPSRLFSSTYLESVWILNYLAAAWLLRECGALDDETAAAVHQVADEAANLIGEFDEGFSNRQTWNNAALTAIAVWFEDEELGRRALESETGLTAHLRGYRNDGLWYEGENYHLFALRGLVTGAGWARHAGVDFASDPVLGPALERALLAPSRTALPDLTFPARKDARYGVSLAQPMYLDTWEVALGRADSDAGRAWLAALYGAAPQPQQLFESYLHDAPYGGAAVTPDRAGLSWQALLEMDPAPAPAEPWRGTSDLLEDHGLVVFRAADRYASVECGPTGGGHGHPDRLHLTLHQGGVHWLPDFGTGSYVTPDLAWYRSTLAHNAPRLDGTSQPMRDATLEMFDLRESWGWARGRFAGLTRTVVAGPRYVLDVVELEDAASHRTELPWHLQGDVRVTSPGAWQAAELDDPFAGNAERFVPGGAGPMALAARSGEAVLTVRLWLEGELWRAVAPGLPGSGSPEPFFFARRDGIGARFVAVLTPDAVEALDVSGEVITVAVGGERHVHRRHLDGWNVDTPAGRITLRGRIPEAPPRRPFLDLDPPPQATAAALRVDEAPALDGTLDRFDRSEPLTLDLEDQYRRSEEPFSGPEDLSARAYAAWDDGALYVAVEVEKPDLVFRAPDAPPLRLDNEPDDIHSDGVQLYVRMPEDTAVYGCLLVPEPGGALRIRPAGGTRGLPGSARGAWQTTETGYRITVAFDTTALGRLHVGARLGFDLLVNEMLPGRVRRVGQLVWSGGGGWVWLRGDRQDPSRLGVLELLG